MNLAWDGEHLLSIQLHHFAVFILTDHREEVQQPAHVLLTRVGVTAATRGVGIQVVRVFLEHG